MVERMMKRCFCVFVGVLLISCFLAGCSGKGEDPKEDSGTSERLAKRYIDLFSNESYFIKYRAEYEEFVDENSKDTLTENYEVAVQGEKLSIRITGEDLDGTMLIVDGKKHMLNHKEKVDQISAPEEGDRWMFPSGGYEFKESGTSELFGVSYMYEEYMTDSGNFRFFFGDQKLVGIEAVAEDENQNPESIKMEILEWSMKVPIGVFDIPEGYEVKEEEKKE